MDALKDTGRELDGATEIRARVSKTPRAVFTLRLGADELDAIAAAARALDQPVGDFIRRAAVQEARQVKSGIDHARSWLATNAPARYRPEMDDGEVAEIIGEAGAAFLEAFAAPAVRSMKDALVEFGADLRRARGSVPRS
jgi:uncharacterized protein (DUF1778 family)